MTRIFVEPPLAFKDEKTFFASNSEDNRSKEKKIKLTDLYNLNKNILFLGKRESGKSTLINYLISHQFNMLHPNAVYGVVIDLEKKIDGKDISIDRMITLALTFLGSNLNKKQITSNLLNGEILVAFDNIDLNNKNELKTVESFIKKYNSCRYIGSTSEPDIIVKDIKVEDNIFHEQVYIHSFGKNQTEELVKKWFYEDINAGIKNLKLVKNLINQLNVPSTPFLISMLLWVVEKQKNPSYLFNEASVIQVLIDGLLNKFGEEKRREDIDSTILSHFLKEFSFYLDSKGITSISNSDFDVFKINYFKEKGLPSKETLRSDLIKNGILYDDNESICFKFDCFRAYFLAEKFNTNQDFWLRIIQEKNIPKYSVELEYFSGIYRDKELLLREMRKYIRDVFHELNLDVDKLAVEKDTSLLLSKKIFGEINTRLEADPVIEHEQEIPNLASIDHSTSRNKIHSPKDDFGHHNALVLLKTFAAILRNSELVEIDLKRSSLDELFDYWNEIFLFLISMVNKDLSSLIKLDLDDEQGSKEEYEEFLKVFNLVITCVYAHIIVEKSSSPKMKQLFEEVFESPKVGHKTLAILCFIDIDLNKSMEMTRRALSSLVGNIFYLQSIYFYYLHKYIENGRFSKSREISTKLKVILGELTFALSGKDSVLKTQVISDTIDRLSNDVKNINILEIKAPEKK